MTPMRRYGIDELIEALRALDRVASTHRRLVVIGGAAVSLHTRAASGTKDIDTWQTDVDDLVEQCAARGIALPPIGSVGVADFPYYFEDRLELVDLGARHLEILIPEPHDLVLGKVLRWAPGDQDDARELHDHRPLQSPVLIERYLGEMDHVMGNQSEHDWNLVHCIDDLFGEIARDEALALVRHHRHRRT